MINFAGWIFLLGGGNLTRKDFDCSENCYLVGRGSGGGGGRRAMNLWCGGVYWGGIFPGGREMGKFLASGGTLSITP